MTERLNEAVAGLYAAFRGYPLRAHIDSCPCCGGNQENWRLHTKPLSDLIAEDLSQYAFRAMTTLGDVDDFRHFLPRILELLTQDLPVDGEVVLSKLEYAGWAQWPAEERSAVRRFLVELWIWARRQPPKPDPYIPAEIGDWLCAIALAESDLRDYLADWEDDSASEAVANRRRFLLDYKTDLAGDESPAGYWEGAQAQWKQVAEWVRATENR